MSSSSQTHEGRKGQNDEFGVSSEEYEENYKSSSDMILSQSQT